MRLFKSVTILFLTLIPMAQGTLQDDVLDFAEQGNLAEFRKLDKDLDTVTLSESLRIVSLNGYKAFTKYLLENHKYSQFTLDYSFLQATEKGQETTARLLKDFGAQRFSILAFTERLYNAALSTAFEAWVPTLVGIGATTFLGTMALWYFKTQHRHIDDCPICFESMTLANSLANPCKHRYHKQCLRGVFETATFDHNLAQLGEHLGVEIPQVGFELAKSILAHPTTTAVSERLARQAASTSDYFNRFGSWFAMNMANNLPFAQAMQIFNLMKQRFTCPTCRAQIIQGQYGL